MLTVAVVGLGAILAGNSARAQRRRLTNKSRNKRLVDLSQIDSNWADWVERMLRRGGPDWDWDWNWDLEWTDPRALVSSLAVGKRRNGPAEWAGERAATLLRA